MITRIYSEEDFHLCVDLFINVFNHEPWNDAWSQEDAEHYLKDYITTPGFRGYIAKEEMKVKGFLLGNRRKWWSGDEFFINEMCIDSASQRSGIGTRLINNLKDDLELEGIDRITLLTNKGIPAEEFYKKNGFTEIKRLIFMSKKI